MSANELIRVLLAGGVIVLTGCGGGGQSSDEDVFTADLWDNDADGRPDINIGTPSITGSYVTSAERVHLAGTTSHWDAEIRWGSDAGYEGHTDPEYEPCWSCRYDWAADVPLAMGENTVTIVITNDDGEGQALIHITRQALAYR